MLQGQTRKAWHMLDEQKSKYYLVDVLGVSSDGEKTKVKFHGQVYQVLTSELLPYQPDKPDKLQQLNYPNKAQLIDWLSSNGADEKWITINNRVALDFNVNTQKHRMQHIKYLLGRFLISFRKKQYLLVANQPIKECNEHTIHEILVKTFPDIINLWPYAISLTTLNFIYRILFTQLPLKFKIFIKEAEIIRLSIIPYSCQSKDLMGQLSNNSFEIMTFKNPIFAVINGSPRDMRRYFKVPDRVSGAKSEYNINNLVDSLVEIGCKIGQINQLIGLFVVILSINQLQLLKSKKQNRVYFKLKQGSQTKDSLNYWLGEQLSLLLQQDLNHKKEADNQLKDIKIKQYVIIKLIWQETIMYAANLINSKMFNFKAQYTQDVRQFIFIEFPALRSTFQQQLYNQKITQINQHIEKVALKIKRPIKAQTLNDEKIESKLKEQYGYDINKDILKQMQKRRLWQSQLSEGQFMTQFKRKKLKLTGAQQQQNAKKSNLNDLFQEITSLYEDDDNIFSNFIIRSEMNNNLPRKQLLELLQESIQQKKKQQNNNQKTENYDWIQLLLSRFQERYRYTEMAKDIYHKKLPTYEGLQAYFSKNSNQGKIRVINDKEIVFLSYQKYRQLEDQRSEHDIKSDKIKKQLKRCKYRKQFLRSVHLSCIKIRFIKSLIKKIQPSIKQIFDDLKIYVAINKLVNPLTKAYIQSEKVAWVLLKKRTAIQIIQKITKNFQKHSIPTLQKQFYQRSKKISKNKKKSQSIQILSNLTKKLMKGHFNDIINNRKEAQQKKQKKQKYQSCLKKGFQQVSLFVLGKGFNNIKKQKKAQTQPLKHQNNDKAKQPSKQQIDKSKNTQNNIVNQKPQSFNQSSNQNKFPQQKIQNNTENTLNCPQQTIQNQQQPNSPALSYLSEPVIHINEPLQTIQQRTADTNEKQVGLKPISQISSKNPKQYNSIKQENNENSIAEYTSGYSNAPSSIGFQKSETSRPITKQQLYSLKDFPKFSFEIWQKQAQGFMRRKPTQVEKDEICKILFNKPDSIRPPNQQLPEQLNVDILIKQKVVVNPFFPYLMDHITASSQDELQKIMSHQTQQLKQSLLKKYPLKEYAKTPTAVFNNILKIGKDKNTTRSVVFMINDILKPARESYSKSEKVATVFDGQPSLVPDYSWSHNIVKDEIFLQFIKQIMMNDKQESLKQLINALQIITRYYYPSPQFIYAFLHYLKSLQSKNIQKLNECFTNTLLFAQAYERYKGNTVTVIKDEVPPKQKESYNKLLMRVTDISQQQASGLCTITLRLFNQQRFQYKVRNQNLSLFKRKLLKIINLLQYEDYFGIYYCKTKGAGMVLIPDTIKAIDFVTKNHQTETQNILYVRMSRYFPFNLKQINKTKIFYLNSLIEERYLPWKQQNYQNVVALSMLFDEFEEYRITNFVIMTGQQSNHNVNISKIEAKYSKLSQQQGKKVNEYQYLKLVKENDFLAAKCYRIKEQLLSPAGVATKLLIKPLQLCFYQDNVLKSSISLKRIKAYYFQKNQINLQIELGDGDNQSNLRQLSLRGVEKANEFYLDLSSYIEYLVDK